MTTDTRQPKTHHNGKHPSANGPSANGPVEKTLSLVKSEVRYRRLFEAAQDGILILDAESGQIEDINPFLINLLGYPREEFIHKKLWELGAFYDIEENKEAFEALQKNEYMRYEDLPLKTKSGGLVDVEFVSNVYEADGERVIQCNIRDITERKRAQQALREESMRDHLTGLFNRRYMEETLQRELGRATRRRHSLGLIMVDADNLKHFNDTWGHAAGDALLQEVGKVLQGQFRGEDVACRYGGDEFVVLLPDSTLKATCERAETLSDFAKKYIHEFEGESHAEVSLSLGVAAFPEHGSSSEALMQACDAALYRAKDEGRGRVMVAEAE